MKVWLLVIKTWGDTYFDWKKFDWAETIQQHKFIGLSLIKLANLYSQTGRQEHAENICNLAIAECAQAELKSYQLSAFKTIYGIYKNKENLKNTLIYQNKCTDLILRAILLFLMCDIIVLFPVVLPDFSWLQLTRTMTDIFFTPALLLLAWLGYRNVTI